jgi:hypothetical protein
MAVRLSALRAGPLYPQEDSWYSFLLEAESTPGATVRLEGLGKLKKSTSSGIEPATFRLVATTLPHAPIIMKLLWLIHAVTSSASAVHSLLMLYFALIVSKLQYASAVGNPLIHYY